MKFFTGSGISKNTLIIIYLINVIVGIVYGWINLYQSSVNTEITDTWAFHYAGLRHSVMLFKHPHNYLQDILTNTYGDGGLFTSRGSYWNNLKGNAFIKLLSVFDCFSFGNYFINVVFYCFIVLAGIVAMYRVMRDHLKTRSPLLIAACFFVPSFLYWNNGLHKDGLCFLGLSAIIYGMYFYINRGLFSTKTIVGILTGAFILFIFKNHLLAALLPALLAWYLGEKYHTHRFKIFLVVYGFTIIFFFGSKYIIPSLNLPAIFAEKQQDFNSIAGGRSSLKVTALEPTVTGFLKALPQAVSLSAFRPYYSDIYNWLVIPSFIELVFLWALVIAALFTMIRKLKTITSFGLFAITYSVSVLLIIGYTVNNLGATVRYRSLILPLLVPLLLKVIYQTKKLYYKNK